MPDQVLNPEKQSAEKPFPWRCPKCGQRTVTRVTMAYRCQRTYDRRVLTVDVPALAVPRCSNCGEVVFDYAADEQIRAAFQASFGPADPVARDGQQPPSGGQGGERGEPAGRRDLPQAPEGPSPTAPTPGGRSG